MTEAMIEVELQRVVAAVAYGEPRPCVGQRRVRFWRSRRDVIRTGRNRSARQSGGKDAGINLWARRRWANSRNRLVGVNTDKLVVPVRTDVTNRQRRVRRDFLFDSQRIRD